MGLSPALVAKKFGILVFCSFYASFLSWAPDERFKDFENYLNYTDSSSFLFLSSYSKGVLEVLGNEPVWLFLNIFLSQFFESEYVVRSIIFLSSFFVSYFAIRSRPSSIFILCIFLLFPGFIKNYLIHLRQGAAIAVFMIGWGVANKGVKWTFILISPLVHSSFFFIVFLMIFNYFLKRQKFAFDFVVVINILAALFVGFGMGSAASILGARQASADDLSVSDGSGLGFILWLILLCVMATSGRNFVRKFYFQISIIIFYISTYWISSKSARIFESGVLLVFLTAIDLPGWRRSFFLGIIISVSIISWLSVIDSPGWGFI